MSVLHLLFTVLPMLWGLQALALTMPERLEMTWSSFEDTWRI